jgi:hypothetical protein
MPGCIVCIKGLVDCRYGTEGLRLMPSLSGSQKLAGDRQSHVGLTSDASDEQTVYKIRSRCPDPIAQFNNSTQRRRSPSNRKGLP